MFSNSINLFGDEWKLNWVTKGASSKVLKSPTLKLKYFFKKPGKVPIFTRMKKSLLFIRKKKVTKRNMQKL